MVIVGPERFFEGIGNQKRIFYRIILYGCIITFVTTLISLSIFRLSLQATGSFGDYITSLKIVYFSAFLSLFNIIPFAIFGRNLALQLKSQNTIAKRQLWVMVSGFAGIIIPFEGYLWLYFFGLSGSGLFVVGYFAFYGFFLFVPLMQLAGVRFFKSVALAAYDRHILRIVATAMQDFLPLAEQGDAEAQYYSGVLYKKGKGIARDFVRAHMWYALAASRLPPGELQNRAVKGRSTVEARMTPDQITEAERLAQEWLAKHQMPE